MTQIDNNQKSALCSAIRTSKYCRKVISLLRDLSEDLFKTDKGNIMTNLEAVLDQDLLTVFKDIFKDVDMKNPVATEEKLREVIEYLKNIEEISLTIPIIPGKDFSKRVYNWCSENINGQILIDFTTNRLMDSGLLLVYKGRYCEYSLENVINEYFATKDFNKYLQETV